MNLVRLQYGGGGGELHGASITVNTEETTLVGKEALLYKVSDLSTIINRAIFSALSSDGVSTVTFNNIIEPDTYIVKSSDGTKKGNTGNIEITSDDVINKTTLVRSLSLSLELNVTFYSASGETIKYKRQNSDELILGKADATGKGNGTIIFDDYGETITFSGDIAKDTTTGTTAYSKDITLTKDTSEIYIMPQKAIYWYGFENTENGILGNIIKSGNGQGTITRNTNSITLEIVNHWAQMNTDKLIDLSDYTHLKVDAYFSVVRMQIAFVNPVNYTTWSDFDIARKGYVTSDNESGVMESINFTNNSENTIPLTIAKSSSSSACAIAIGITKDGTGTATCSLYRIWAE